jgi:hypothetical protein
MQLEKKPPNGYIEETNPQGAMEAPQRSGKNGAVEKLT